MGCLAGKVAWVTGAGSGIGQAGSIALAEEGATVVLTGRRAEASQETARRIGPGAVVRSADVTDGARIGAVAAEIGRLDIVVNNAGMNLVQRAWSELMPASIDQVLGTNLNSAFYAVAAALPLMHGGRGRRFHPCGVPRRTVLGRAERRRLHHGQGGNRGMSHSIDREEFADGIRSTVLHPGETATEILRSRGTAMPAEELARLLRPQDCAEMIRTIACLPPHVCVNEVVMTPTWNRTFAETRPLPRRV